VKPGTPGRVEAHLDPGPYAPRQNAPKAGRPIREFDRRVGDPNTGGTTVQKRVTVYRQDALRCAAHLAAQGRSKAAEVAAAAGFARAGQILRDDHYGWFERVERGVYALTPKGRAEAVEQGMTLIQGAGLRTTAWQRPH
jgi:hypothetical protein